MTGRELIQWIIDHNAQDAIISVAIRDNEMFDECDDNIVPYFYKDKEISSILL